VSYSFISSTSRKEATAMSRKEVVLLVSRAFAACQLATAFLELSYLPERLFSMYHHAKLGSVLSDSAADDYFRTLDQIGVRALIARIAALLILTVIFWNCGPWVERLVLPKQEA
jgi:hypothetical protein